MSRCSIPRSLRRARGEARHVLADFPEATLEVPVVGEARGALLRRVVVEVLAGDARYLRRGCEVNRRSRALFWRPHERRGEPHAEAEETGAVVPEAGRDDPGMQAVRGDASALEPAREL